MGRTGKGDPEASPVVCGAMDANVLCTVTAGVPAEPKDAFERAAA